MVQFSRFNEEDHPRDEDGKFTSKGGGSSAGKGETPHSGQAGNKDYGKDMLAKNKVFDKAPDGWKPIEGATTAPKGYKWYSNGKSMFGGDYEQALVKIGESEEETKDAPKVEEQKFVYQIASNDGTEMLEEDELLKKHQKAGTNQGGRDEIQGKPIFKGLYGPFYNGKTKDGKVIIRYETAGHYNTYD